MKRARFILIITLLIVLSIFGMLGYLAVGRAKAEAQTFAQVSLSRLALIGEINANQAEGYARVLLLLSTGDAAERATLRTAIDDYRVKNDDAIRLYAATLTTDDSRKRLEEFTHRREQYGHIRDQVMAMSNQGQGAEAFALARTSLWPAYREYTEAGDVALRSDVSGAQRQAEHIRRVCEISQVLAALVAALGFIGGITLPFTLAWLGRGIASEAPLRH